MIPDSATTAVQNTDSFDLDRADRSAEVRWWRQATDNGRDTAFGRKLAAEKAQVSSC
jgi:hypothetical protein